MQEYRISPRERLVLMAILEMYIATGEPVSSQLVARHFEHREGLSSATIRNVMSALGDAGLLDQPHTSAGRIPTARGFRYYVEQLQSGALAAIDGGLLDEQQRGRIQESYSGVSSPMQFLERTSQVLAQVSNSVGVALARPEAEPMLEHIHFSRLTTGRVLAVMVTRDGAVQDRLLRTQREWSAGELDGAGQYLNENFRGWPLDRIRDELDRRLEMERREYSRGLAALNELYAQGALRVEPANSTVYVDGMANLLAGGMDREQLRQMLVTLETRQRVIELLQAFVHAQQREVRVIVGLDDAVPGMQDMVLIGAPVSLGSRASGTVAVIASTRIQYEEMMRTVGFIAQLSERVLSERVQSERGADGGAQPVTER
jgi:heat-inducible transcriptional repressor